MARILGYSWAGIRTEDFEGTIRFFTEKLGMPLTWRAQDTDIAHLRLPSGQLFEVFGPNSDYYGVHGTTCPVVGFEVEDVEAAREELAQRGVEFVTEVDDQGSEEGASWVYFRGPDGQLYELQRPSKPYRMDQH
jgi:catechol 2,3-dioxygenase-like lactoylglutathione lyase family enzyme